MTLEYNYGIGSTFMSDYRLSTVQFQLFEYIIMKLCWVSVILTKNNNIIL